MSVILYFNCLYYRILTTVSFVIELSIFSELFNINSSLGINISHLYNLAYLILNLDVSLCFIVPISIILPDSTYLYTCLACSSVERCLSLMYRDFGCLPVFAFKGKSVMGSILPFIS